MEHVNGMRASFTFEVTERSSQVFYRIQDY